MNVHMMGRCALLKYLLIGLLYHQCSHIRIAQSLLIFSATALAVRALTLSFFGLFGIVQPQPFSPLSRILHNQNLANCPGSSLQGGSARPRAVIG